MTKPQDLVEKVARVVSGYGHSPSVFDRRIARTIIPMVKEALLRDTLAEWRAKLVGHLEETLDAKND